MPRYKVWAIKTYEITVEAPNENEAYDEAFSTPLDQWEDDYDIDTQIEEIVEDTVVA